MASQEIDDFTVLTTPAAGDLLPIVDVSDTTDSPQGTTKKIVVSDLVTGGILPDDSVANAKLANMAQGTLKGRAAGAGTGDPTDLTGTQATAILDNVVGDGGLGGTKGLVPAPAAGDAAAGKFLKADGTFAVPSGTGAPSDATFITQTPSSGLSNEQAMSALATGLVKNTTTTGVQSIADANDLSSPVYAADGGASDAYAITLSPAPSAYQTGAHYRFKANTANTGAATLNVNGLGAVAIKKVAGGVTTDLSDNDIRSGQIVDVVYDGTNFQIQSTLGNAGTGASVNPTSGTIPYNNAGSFADSPIARLDATTVRAEVFHGAGASDVNTNGVISGRGTGVVVGRDLHVGLQNGSGTLDALLSKPNTRHSGLLSVRRTTSGSGATFAYPPDSPAQITANQNDYSLGTGRSFYQRLSSDASRDITGLTIPSDGLGNTQVPGQSHLLINVGSNNIVLKHESASSSAANRFLCSTGADITLGANEAADVFYDNTTQRWRVFKR